MDLTPFRIDYTDQNEIVVHSETVRVSDDFDACDHGWEHMPEGAVDFQVTLLGGETL